MSENLFPTSPSPHTERLSGSLDDELPLTHERFNPEAGEFQAVQPHQFAGNLAVGAITEVDSKLEPAAAGAKVETSANLPTASTSESFLAGVTADVERERQAAASAAPTPGAEYLANLLGNPDVVTDTEHSGTDQELVPHTEVPAAQPEDLPALKPRLTESYQDPAMPDHLHNAPIRTRQRWLADQAKLANGGGGRPANAADRLRRQR